MTRSSNPSQMQGTTFMSHLLELRDRLMRAGGAVLVLFIVAAPFANTLYEYLAEPLMAALPEGNSMISTEPHGPFFVPFKFAFAFAAAVAMPYLLYQLWAFVAPGLYEHEKRLTVPLLVSSSVLFYLGILFAYFVVFPLIFAFFTSTAPEGVLVMTDISAYLSFVLKLFFAFGLAFEVPVATVLMVRMGMTTPESLATKRPYIIVGAFVAGMLMTPPDIFSQTMLAIPVWLLFEAGLYFSRSIKARPADAEAEADEDDMALERELDDGITEFEELGTDKDTPRS
ncbi:MAG: twin-arginine translocase subunit TatC [Arenicellales bacterium]|nr:twin-arginine translocase subunit TatC [Arenicellales bacterium]MDP6792193.1 twin-arginine translocase subunit TatC [Arenicellales bacterium]MDP6919947.1 twin-arginine translocase subunit TatC [Arenicellales bacterium]